MTYFLSISQIIDTVQAIAALHIFSAPAGRCEALTSMLAPSRHDLMEALAKDAFAETLVAILPYVADSNLDNCDSSGMLTVEISSIIRISDGTHPVVRRSLEQSIAYRILNLCLLSLPGDDSSLAEEMLRKATFHLDKAVDLLRSGRANHPFIR